MARKLAAKEEASRKRAAVREAEAKQQKLELRQQKRPRQEKPQLLQKRLIGGQQKRRQQPQLLRPPLSLTSAPKFSYESEEELRREPTCAHRDQGMSEMPLHHAAPSQELGIDDLLSNFLGVHGDTVRDVFNQLQVPPGGESAVVEAELEPLEPLALADGRNRSRSSRCRAAPSSGKK